MHKNQRFDVVSLFGFTKLCPLKIWRILKYGWLSLSYLTLARVEENVTQKQRSRKILLNALFKYMQYIILVKVIKTI